MEQPSGDISLSQGYKEYVRSLDDGTNPMCRTLSRILAWILAGRCKIIDRDDPSTPVPLRLRTGQLLIFEKAFKQALKHKPIRIIVPKYRRHGISTVCQAIGLGIARLEPYRNCRTVAHEEKSSQKIFSIAHIMWKQDGQKKGERGKQKVIEPPDMESDYQCMTGAGHFTGSGDTIHFLHVSELAKFPNTSEQDRKALNSMLNAVSQTSPQSVIILESSGQGPDGVFPDRCRAAYEGKSTYECVFLPWLMDTSLQIDVDELPDEFDPPLKGDEITLRDSYKATEGQIAWRRQKMQDDFPGVPYSDTPPAFAWDYPTVLEDCFGQKSGRIFPNFNRKKHVGHIDPNDLSKSAYKTRAIDWGGSENHPFACLWLLIDPEKPPQLIVNESCTNFIAEMEKYAWNPKTGEPVKADDHGVDALRYGATTLNAMCLVYVYRELYESNPAEATHTKLPRKIHQMSGWVHPSGNPNHPDIAAHVPGPNADIFEFGGDINDERFSFDNYDGDTATQFKEAIRLGAGVADKAQYRSCIDYTTWGIPLIPHCKPPGPSQSGYVKDGINFLQTVISGDTVLKREKPPEDRELAISGEMKLRQKRAILPTDEEFEAMRRERGMGKRHREDEYSDRCIPICY